MLWYFKTNIPKQIEEKKFLKKGYQTFNQIEEKKSLMLKVETFGRENEISGKGLGRKADSYEQIQ